MNLLYCVDYHVLGIFLCSLRSIVLHGGYEHYNVYVLHSCFDEKMEAAINHDFKGIMTFHFIRVSDTLFTEFPETGFSNLFPFPQKQPKDFIPA